MGKLISVTGGARSGKSSLALGLAKAFRKKKVFIATCIVRDEEMKERVRRHRRSRPAAWRTVEAGADLVCVLKKETQGDVVLVVDCLTLFVSQLLVRGDDETRIKEQIERVVNIIAAGQAAVIMVSNEVGAGLVPENKLGRDFRDLAGICNQIVAARAEDVYFTISGIPVKIKGGDGGRIISGYGAY